MKLIPLFNRKKVVAHAMVDDEDYEKIISMGEWLLAPAQYGQMVERVNGKTKTTMMHRVIMLAPRKKHVHHKDKNGLNNQKKNLALCTRSENMHAHTPPLSVNKTSSSKGVYKERIGRGKFTARIRLNGTRKRLGFFETEKDAAYAYQSALRENVRDINL